MNNKERYFIDRCIRVSMDLFIADDEKEELLHKTIHFDNLENVTIEGVGDHIVHHMEDIMNGKSFILGNIGINFDNALVTTEMDKDEC